MLMNVVVSRAFQVLSDSDKKSRYDKFGGDPDSRFNPGAAGPSAGDSPFGGFGGGFPRSSGGSMFEEEISPEELFNRFFGGGFGGMGGGEFSSFGMGLKRSHISSNSLVNFVFLFSFLLTLCRWPTVCLQHGRRSRLPCSPVRWPPATKKAPRSCLRCRHPIPLGSLPNSSPSHLPFCSSSPLVVLLRVERRLLRSVVPLRCRGTPAHHASYNSETQHRLLYYSGRYRGLQLAETRPVG